jgi:hypothetical protein
MEVRRAEDADITAGNAVQTPNYLDAVRNCQKVIESRVPHVVSDPTTVHGGRKLRIGSPVEANVPQGFNGYDLARA